MKKPITLILSILFLSFSYSYGQHVFYADFETFDSSPYFFRFGNNTGIHHFPRWQYSHELVENPLKNTVNSSEKVLKYTSLEARWYGLKIKFPSPLNFSDMDTISFFIYQPEHVVGKPVDLNYSPAVADKQELRVKLLTGFNAIRDFKEDDGAVLTAVPFLSTGEWIEYKAALDQEVFTQAELKKLAQGIRGIAIMPTYNSNVTLQERYECYIDNIVISRNADTGNKVNELNKNFSVYLADNKITIHSDVQGEAVVNVYDIKGMLCTSPGKTNLEKTQYEYPVNINTGTYIVSIYFEGRYHNYKVIGR